MDPGTWTSPPRRNQLYADVANYSLPVAKLLLRALGTERVAGYNVHDRDRIVLRQNATLLGCGEMQRTGAIRPATRAWVCCWRAWLAVWTAASCSRQTRGDTDRLTDCTSPCTTLAGVM